MLSRLFLNDWAMLLGIPIFVTAYLHRGFSTDLNTAYSIPLLLVAFGIAAD